MSNLHPALLPVLAVLFTLSSRLPAQDGVTCPPQGATLTVTGGRLGDLASVTLAGSPNVSGLLAVDVGGGPTPTPLGPLCLDLSPLMLLLPVTLDGAGLLSLSTILPPLPVLSGVTLFFQAALLDALQPGGLALTNDGRLDYRSPHLYWLSPGFVTPFGGVPAQLGSMDALTGAIGFQIASTPAVVGMAHVSSLGWLIVVRSDGSVLGLNDDTGVVEFQASLPGGNGAPIAMGVSPDQTRVVVATSGTPPSPFGGGSPGAVKVVAIPGGALASMPLAAARPSGMILDPALPMAWLRTGASIVPVDYVALAEQPAAQMGPSPLQVVDWAFHGDYLYTLLGAVGQPTSMNGVQRFTALPHLALPQGLPGAGTPISLRAGPGSAGPALMALTQTPELLIEVTPVGLAVQGFAALPPGVAFCELSSQGTRWLLVQDGGAGVPGQLLALEPASLAVGLVAMLPAEPQNGLIALRSDSLGRAWCLSGLSNLTPLPTDPFGPADPLISLPAAYTAPLRMIGE